MTLPMVPAYWLLRLIHGYWRWAVLLSAVVALVRGICTWRRDNWTPGDDRASRAFVAAVDVQVSLGLILYFAFSPFWPAVRDSFHDALRDPSSRFFGMEHGTAMLVALAAAHVGRVRVRRALEPRMKQRALIVSLAVFFAIAAWAIPWPWRAMGRPLFRTSL
jgi:heme A synthase